MKASVLAVNGGEKAVSLEMPPWPLVDAQTERAVVKALRTAQLSILTKSGAIGDFEDNFAKFVGCKYALAVNGGTSALDLAVFGSGAGPGDEVITTPHTWGATAACIIHQNAIPVFADVDEKTMTLDAKKVEAKITSRTKAIIAVHIYGHPCDMDAIMRVARRHKVMVIEDCAQAHGATYKGRPVGSLGDIGCFSFQGGKNLTCGEGGMLLTDKRDVYENILAFSSHPARWGKFRNPKYHKYVDGLFPNYRMHPLGAAFANAQLPRLKKWTSTKQDNVARLYEKVSGLAGVRPGHIASWATHGFHMVPFTYHADELGGLSRADFLKAIQAEGVPIFNYIGTPIHLRPRHQDFEYYGKKCPWHCPHARGKIKYCKGETPVAERLAEIEMQMPGTPLYKPLKGLMGQYARALRKVVEHADDVPREKVKRRRGAKRTGGPRRPPKLTP